jgi:hypothetical protein
LLAGIESVQDGYDNERGDQGDKAESDDELSDEEAVYIIQVHRCCS